MEPRRVDFVVLTHAHLDHSGLLPKLCAAGFTGPIYATPATRELVGVLLPDSAHLQKVEAERAARHGRDFTAVYGIEEVATALGQLNAVPYDQILARLPPASSDCGDRSGLRRVFIGSTAESCSIDSPATWRPRTSTQNRPRMAHGQSADKAPDTRLCFETIELRPIDLVDFT